MGIISSIQTKHEQNLLLPGQGRTDNNTVKTKWNALRKQEISYKKMYNIDLRMFRKNIDLKNTSWNGAVTGYLY